MRTRGGVVSTVTGSVIVWLLPRKKPMSDWSRASMTSSAGPSLKPASPTSRGHPGGKGPGAGVVEPALPGKSLQKERLVGLALFQPHADEWETAFLIAGPERHFDMSAQKGRLGFQLQPGLFDFKGEPCGHQSSDRNQDQNLIKNAAQKATSGSLVFDLLINPEHTILVPAAFWLCN